MNYNNATINGMIIAGRLASSILDRIEPYVKPGISTLALNDLCHDMIVQANAIPAPLNYKNFPKSICTSINDVVCHGIPDKSILVDGDIINIDVTVIINGWHGDTSRTYLVGDSFKNPSPKQLRIIELARVTYEAMMVGIAQIGPGVPLAEIGRAIEKYVKPYGFSIVREYCGHGIGKKFHMAPNVLHYYEPSEKSKMVAGTFLTVEPMLNLGKADTYVSSEDHWTVRTADGSLSAQYEHTIAIVDDGYKILTDGS